MLGLPLGERRLQALRRIGALVEAPSLYGHFDRRGEPAPAAARFRGSRAADRGRASRRPASSRRAGAWCGTSRSGCGSVSALPWPCSTSPSCWCSTSRRTASTPPASSSCARCSSSSRDSGRVTVFLSSHLLGELEQTITRLAVINRGRLRYQGTLAELRQREPVVLRLAVGDPARAIALLRDAGHAPALAEAGGISLAAPGADDRARERAPGGERNRRPRAARRTAEPRADLHGLDAGPPRGTPRAEGRLEGARGRLSHRALEAAPHAGAADGVRGARRWWCCCRC